MNSAVAATSEIDDMRVAADEPVGSIHSQLPMQINHCMHNSSIAFCAF